METVEKPSLIQKLSAVGANHQRLLGIFVKEPIAGKVKTRLCPPLQPEESAELYRIAMQESIGRFVAGPVPVVLFYAGSEDYFREAFPAVPLWPQHPGDLGQRMDEALRLLLETGCRAAALIGSDSPDLPVEQVADAFDALAERDAVTIPAGDGGYVLVGTSRPCPEIFADIPWSTGEVLTLTRQRAAQASIDYYEVGGWDDIDDLASLQALLKRSPGSLTACFVKEKLTHCL